VVRTVEAPLVGRHTAGVLAYLGAASFAGLLASISRGPRSRIPPLLGVISHVSLLPAIAWLPAPSWARPGGYAWMLLDTLLGVFELNLIASEPPDDERERWEKLITWMRYGLHVCAATWIIPASWRAPGWRRVLGVVFGASLGGFSFVAHRLPRPAMAPIGVLQVAWLAWIGWTLQRSRGPRSRRLFRFET